MSESKTFILPDGQGGGGMIPLLASLCQQRGIDRWIYLSNEGGIHLFVGIQLSHLYLRYLPSE